MRISRRRFALLSCAATASVAALAFLLSPGSARAEGNPDLAAAAKAAGTANGLCPVMKRPVKPRGGSTEYRGEKIGYCCPGCARKFERDPARFMDEMRADPAKYGYTSRWPSAADLKAAAEAAGSANGLCPVLEKPVTPKGGSVEHEGQKIAFCCPGCAEKFAKDPDGYLRKMRADPTAFGYDRPGPTNAELRAAREAARTANGLCPVCERLVAAAAGTAEYGEETIGFATASCRERFAADPKGFVEKMRREPVPYGYLPPAK